jgi:hypothetical protein
MPPSQEQPPLSLRDQYRAWLESNGINPADVHDDTQLTVKRDPDGQSRIHYTEYVRDPETGNKLVDPNEPNQLWRRPASTHLTVPAPAGLALPPVFIRRYRIPLDGQPHDFTIGLGPIHWHCRNDDAVDFWAFTPTPGTGLVRRFIGVRTDDPLPVASWHAGTAITSDGFSVWHVLELPRPFDCQTPVAD